MPFHIKLFLWSNLPLLDICVISSLESAEHMEQSGEDQEENMWGLTEPLQYGRHWGVFHTHVISFIIIKSLLAVIHHFRDDKMKIMQIIYNCSNYWSR